MIPLVVLLVVIRAIRDRNATHRSIAELPPEPSTVLCPRCAQPTQAGFAVAGRGIHWRGAQAKPIGIFATVFSVLPNTISMSIPTRENRAWRCAGCAIVVIDHSALVGRPR